MQAPGSFTAAAVTVLVRKDVVTVTHRIGGLKPQDLEQGLWVLLCGPLVRVGGVAATLQRHKGKGGKEEIRAGQAWHEGMKGSDGTAQQPISIQAA